LTIRVAVADDHPTLLAGMAYLLSAMTDATVTGLAADSTELVELLGREPCDVVVTDYSMPGGRYGDGISLFGFLLRRFPNVRLVVLTGLESQAVLQGILAAGFDAIVAKADDPEYLQQAIRAVHERKPFLSPEIQRMLDAVPAPRADGGVQSQLSKRETEVVRLFAEGLSVSEIGDRVGRSRKTISTQKVAAMKKLGLQNDAELFRYALANGLIQSSHGSREPVSDND
jgi:two-component system capsular synthesis response regulator RcsB